MVADTVASDDEDTASSVVRQLVQHYNQPIHLNQASVVLCSDDDDDDDDDDYDYGDCPPLSAIDQVLLKQLVAIPAVMVLRQYRPLIRGVLFAGTSLQPMGTVVLQHYALLLRHSCLQHGKEQDPNGQESAPPKMSVPSLAGNVAIDTVSYEHSTNHDGGIPSFLHWIFSDIARLSAKDNKDATVVMELLWQLLACYYECSAVGGSEKNPKTRERAVLTAHLLAFADSIVLDDDKDYPHIALPSTFLVLPLSQESSLLLDTNTAENAPKIRSDSSRWQVDTATKMWEEHGPVSSLVTSATAVREYFFGRYEKKPSENSTALQQRLHMGHLVMVDLEKEREERSADLVDGRPYQRVPSRLHAVLAFVCLLLHTQDQQETFTAAMSAQLVDILMPVAYELLNGNNDMVIGKGAFVVAALLALTKNHSCCWASHTDNILVALETVVATCRNGGTLLFAGSVQRKVLLQVQQPPKRQMGRRKTTQKWLVLLRGSIHSPAEKMLSWGVLLVLLQLLFDHVHEENADAVELGRPGLAALLPLIRRYHEVGGAQHDSQVPMLAVLVLSNLVVTAHPVVGRHTNKILSELLACIGHNRNRFSIHSRLEETVLLHCLSLTVKICGKDRVDVFCESLGRLGVPSTLVDLIKKTDTFDHVLEAQ